MKKKYEAPEVEVVNFQYEDVILTSTCQGVWVNIGDFECSDGNKHIEYLN